MDASSIYSCDDHLDLGAVPPEVWESRLPKAQVERAPHVVERDGVRTWVCSDRVLGASGRPPGAPKGLGAIGRAGIEDDGFRASNPHMDSTFPESQRAIEEALGTLSAEDRRKITALNCAKLYGFEYVA